ncbi:o-succinylbenzoate synthase, partial [Streptosporangium algeriense]
RHAETGLGRAANLALAALPGFTLPGDISATARYYERDVTAPFVLTGGEMTVPSGPGIGITPVQEDLDALTTATEWIAAP